MNNPADPNAELHERLIAILRSLWDKGQIDSEALKIICYSAGVDYRLVVLPRKAA